MKPARVHSSTRNRKFEESVPDLSANVGETVCLCVHAGGTLVHEVNLDMRPCQAR